MTDMKIYKLFLLLATVTLAAGSCFDNNDDVDYNSSYNKVTLSDPLAGDVEMVVDQFSVLNLTPTISQSHITGESNLEFKWTFRQFDEPRNPGDIYDLAETRNLSEEISAAVGKHRIVYSVTDKTTNVTTFLYYQIRVIGVLTEGWTLLEETPQGGDISMVLPTGTVYHNVYSTRNGSYMDTPRSLAFINFNTYKRLLALTATQGIECSLDDFSKVSEFESWFISSTAPTGSNVNPRIIRGITSSWIGMINNDKFHVRIAGGFPEPYGYGGYLTAPIDADGYSRDYRLAPFLLRTSSTYSGPLQIMYDNLHKRFMYGFNSGLIPSLGHYPYSPGEDEWNPSNVGMTMRHMDESRVAYQHNAVLQDDAGDLYLLVCDGTAVVTAANRFPKTKTLLPATLKGFTVAMSSKSLDHMYFVVGNKIYRYDIPAEQLYEEYTFAANENPTVIKSTSTGGSETLYIATYNGSEGKLYAFDMLATGAMPSSHTKVDGGFSKIVDLVYKQ